MFRLMLMAGASRAALAPNDDEGHDYADADDAAQNAELDEDLDDADDGDEAGGAEDRFDDDDDGDDEGDEDGQAQVAARPSRGQNRISALNERARAAEQEAETLRRRLADAEAQRTAASSAETQRQEQERLAMMDPGERAEYIARQTAQRTEQMLNQMRFEAQDAADKAAFAALCAQNPAAAKVQDRVETYLADMRKAGTTAPRETVLRYVLGDMALSRAPRARAAGKRAEAAGRERQRVAAPNARGDTPQNSGRSMNEQAARRARLENVRI